MQKKKGISLIVLVITIIVMIILAAAVIISLNNNGIINNAKDAVDKTNEKQVQEIAQVAWGEAYIRGEKKQPQLEAAVKKALTDNNLDPDDYFINVTDKGVTIKGQSWKKSVSEIIDDVPIPKGFVASGATGENSKNTGLVIYEGNEQVTDTNVNEARRSRNQYVWVPVENMSEFKRQNFGMSYTISTTVGDGFWELTPTMTFDAQAMKQEDLNEVTAMYNSVEKYGGFYVARYEAGLDAQRMDDSALMTGANVKSQMNKYVYNFVKKKTSIEVARSIYPNNSSNTTGVISTFIYGVQWDTILQWLLDSGAVERVIYEQYLTPMYGNYKDYYITDLSTQVNEGALYSTAVGTENSYNSLTSVKTPGSPSTSWLMTTGALKAASTNNIYDLAGNVLELTMEEFGSPDSSVVRRGGSYHDNLSDYPAASRFAYWENSPGDVVFRVTLYIK